jgi:hypothetical protein
LLALPSLPLLRIQPIHFQGTLDATWKAASVRISDWLPAVAANYFGAQSSPAPQYA